jgi:hypothetical protein
MRVDNRVNQPHPARHRDNEVQVAAPTTVPTVPELSSQPSPTVLASTPADLHRVATAIARSSLTVLLPVAVAATLTVAATTTEAPTMEPTGGPAAAAAVAAAEATRTATPLAPRKAATTPARRLKSCCGRSQPL